VVSAHLRRHSVTKVLGSLVAGLDSHRFHLGLFHLGERTDAVTAQLRATAALYLQGDHRPAHWLKAIAEFAADVVLYLDLGMDPVAQILACFRLAPVQAVLWGHPITSGAPEIDWFLSADATEVADPTAHYSERVFRLPGLGTCYHAPLSHPRGRRTDAEVHYLLAQSAPKITPLHDAVLARIAAELPQARFTLIPGPRAHVGEALAARMRPAFERSGAHFERQVRILTNVPEAEFLALSAGMDLNLDSIGWSGGVSSLDLLAQHLPTVCVDTPTLRGRQTAAMLRRIGCGELVAEDVEGYVQVALTLGRDRDLRESWRNRIRSGVHALYDDQAPVAALAEFLLRTGSG
jgi:predicted O-linked N-acetylglucosamine transferase (SPINDLY family)